MNESATDDPEYFYRFDVVSSRASTSIQPDVQASSVIIHSVGKRYCGSHKKIPRKPGGIGRRGGFISSVRGADTEKHRDVKRKKCGTEEESSR